MSPVRAQVSSPMALPYSIGNSSSLAKAAVMMTSDRQFPWRAANASAALRVRSASYSSLSSPLLKSASTSACRRPLTRACSAISVRR